MIDFIANWDTLIWFLGTIVIGLVIEFSRYFTGRPLITTQVRDANRAWPSLGVLLTIAAGLLLGHFFLGSVVPFSQGIGIVFALVSSLIIGAVWFR